MQTDKLFTGQREITGLGIYHFGARFYSPKLGRFLSADTIVPGYTNPQSLNRYSYVLNMPIIATDPSGHKCVSTGPGDCLNATNKPINGAGGLTPAKKHGGNQNNNNGGGGGLPAQGPNPIKGSSNGNSDSCDTVTCRALGGDVLATADLLIPTHFGWRGQFELSTSPVQIFPGFGIGPSGTLGVNIAYNRVSGEFAAFADWTVEGGGGLGIPVGASFTEGPIVGWGSSTVKDIAQGNSGTISATAAYEGALSVGISAPVDGDSFRNIRPHVDSVYGQIPVTVYVGGGIGGAYAGTGGGGSHVFVSSIIDVSP
jgi:RHS repeat-associated protein